jgi:hypothetical protein
VRIARLAALAAAALLVVAASSRRDPVHAAPQDGDYAAARAELDQRLEKLRAQYHAFPQPADTPEEIGRLLKHDPTACAAFIRRALRYEP